MTRTQGIGFVPLVMLAGCSFMMGPHPSSTSIPDKCSVVAPVLDTVQGAVVLGVGGLAFIAIHDLNPKDPPFIEAGLWVAYVALRAASAIHGFRGVEHCRRELALVNRGMKDDP